MTHLVPCLVVWEREALSLRMCFHRVPVVGDFVQLGPDERWPENVRGRTLIVKKVQFTVTYPGDENPPTPEVRLREPGAPE